MRGDINPGDVAHVEIALTTYALRRITSRYPTTAESAKFSGPYLAAYTLVHGAPLLAAFTEEALRDEAVRAAAQKVSLVTYQEYADVLDESPAKVTVTLNDGRKLEGTKYYSSGSVQVPMSAAQLKAKFDVCAAQAVDQTAAARIYAILSTLGDEPSPAEFWPLLHKA
jgi:2-methylcitrate dehydratase PrpD